MKKTDFPYLEINGWSIKRDINGNILFDFYLNPKDYYTIYLMKNFVIECSFLKSEYDPIPEEEKDHWLKRYIQVVIFNYGRNKSYPWMD